jgi:hypothetical protein
VKISAAGAKLARPTHEELTHGPLLFLLLLLLLLLLLPLPTLSLLVAQPR